MTSSLYLSDSKPVAHVFGTAKIEKHLTNNPVRAFAIFDIVRGLIADGNKPINMIRAALIRKQPHQAIHMLGNFRACMINFEGMRCCDVAEELEERIEDGSHPSILNTLLDCLETELKNFTDQATRWLTETESNYKPAVDTTEDNHKAELGRFCEALSTNSLMATERFNVLYEYLQKRLPEPDFFDLELAIHQLEYQKALQITETLAR